MINCIHQPKARRAWSLYIGMQLRTPRGQFGSALFFSPSADVSSLNLTDVSVKCPLMDPVQKYVTAVFHPETVTRLNQSELYRSIHRNDTLTGLQLIIVVALSC